MSKADNFKVTPYNVAGNVDYEKLISEFGTKPITGELMRRIEKLAGESHFMLRRGIFFTHRDLPWLLDEYEKGNAFYLYTGRGPSHHTHIGHLVPWIFTKWLQDRFGAKLIFMLTDDEKFLSEEKLDLNDTHQLAYDNALDVVALGFDPSKTEIIIDTDYAKTLYREALKIAKKINFSTVKAAFGFSGSTNIGFIFYTSIQAVPSILESVRKGERVPCLIPHGVDQDPHFRVTRDVLPHLGYYKPASIQSIFLPPLSGIQGKMSSSDPNNTIFVTDSPDTVKRKIRKYAFSGGQPTVEEHRRLGGNPDVDVSFQWLRIMFEPDDRRLNKIREDYLSGALLTGELKEILIEKINTFLAQHQEKREKAKNRLEDFLIRD